MGGMPLARADNGGGGSATLSRWPTVEIHLPIDNVRHVAPFTEELHHLLAGACHLRPPGFCLRILLKSSNVVSIKGKIYLPKASL